MTATPRRNETQLRIDTLPILVEIVRERLRGATLLALTFEPADADECVRGYVAWEREDQCGSHGFTLQLGTIGDAYAVTRHASAPMLHGGHYELPGPLEAVADAHARAMSSYRRARAAKG